MYHRVWSVKRFSSYSIFKFGISCVLSSVKLETNFKNPFQCRLLRQYFVVSLVIVEHWHPKIIFWVDLVIFGHQVVGFANKRWSRSVMRIVFSNVYISKTYTWIFSYDTSKFPAFQGLSIGRKKSLAIFDLGGVLELLVSSHVQKVLLAILWYNNQTSMKVRLHSGTLFQVSFT